jgi:ribosomal protein S18 acetylase RimI-like enzyme
MNKDISIRLAANDDIAAIEKVARLTWQLTYSAIISPDNQERWLGQNYAPSALTKAISRIDSWFFVAIFQSKIVGFAQFLLRKEKKSGELTRIYVLPEYQRRGAGGLLLEEGLAALSKSGIDRLFVDVEKDNPIGRQFYEKKGFRQVKEFVFPMTGQSLPMVEYVLDEFIRAG